MRATTNYRPDPAKFVDQWVRATTYPDTVWRVWKAYPIAGGAVRLCLESADGQTLWSTDNEHSTIVPNYRPPVEDGDAETGRHFG